MRNFLTMLVFVVFSISAPAIAAPIQSFDFIARLDQESSIAPLGTIITGSFSYDPSLSPTSTYNYPGVIGANYDNISVNLDFRFGALDFSSGGFAGVNNTSFEGNDFYLIGANSAINGGIYVWDPLATFLNGTSLPTNFPALWQGPFVTPDDDDGLTVPHGEFSFYDSSKNSGFNAVILSITAASAGAVPEPATWIVMILGFGYTGFIMRKRTAGNYASRRGCRTA